MPARIRATANMKPTSLGMGPHLARRPIRFRGDSQAVAVFTL